jgi:ribose 5-phosphate isomerase B
MSIFIASDHAGYGLKQVLLKFLKEDLLLEVVDLGCNSSRAVDYPDFAKLLVRNVKSDKENRGILLCGTGVGMTITANRTKGIRCALCH